MPDTAEKVYIKEKGGGVATAGLVTGVAALTGVAAKWLGNALDNGTIAPFHHRHGGFQEVERLAKVEAFQASDKEITALQIQNSTLQNQLAIKDREIAFEAYKGQSEARIKGLEHNLEVLNKCLEFTAELSTTPISPS